MSAQSAEADDDGWRFLLSGYGWLAGVDGTVATGSRTEFPVSVPFQDILANLDFAMSLHVEGKHRSGWSFLTDVFFANLGAEGAIPESELTLSVDQKQTVLEGAVGYELWPGWEVLAVTRYNNLSVSAAGSTRESDVRGAAWIDAFGGVRFSHGFGERWAVALRSDVGAGGSSLSWFWSGAAFYAMSDLVSIGGGYRGLKVDYEDGEGRDFVKWDMFTHGLSLGVVLTP